MGPGKGSPSVFRTAWLPRHASVDGLCSALGVGGSFGVTRLSTDAPTCEDGAATSTSFLSHLFSLASTNAVTTVPWHAVYITLLDAPG